MKEVRSIIHCDKIVPEKIDIPVVLCDENWKVIYKNKIAYLYKFPRVGASLLKCACGLSSVHLSEGSVVHISFSWNIEDYKTAYAVRGESGGMILVFLRAFSLGDHKIGEDDFNNFIVRLTRKMDFSSKAVSDLPIEFLRLERRCLSTALESYRNVSGSEMPLDRVSYVIDEYFKRIFKSARRTLGIERCGFSCDFPYSRISYVKSSELLAACFLLIASRLAFYGGGSIEILLSKRDTEAVFEGIVTPQKSIDHVMAEFEASVEMLILRRLADIHGWKFEIKELLDMERIAFRLYAQTYQHTHVLTSEVRELSKKEALAFFLSFIGG